MNVVYKVTSGKRPPISHMPANTPKNVSNYIYFFILSFYDILFYCYYLIIFDL